MYIIFGEQFLTQAKPQHQIEQLGNWEKDGIQTGWLSGAPAVKNHHRF